MQKKVLFLPKKSTLRHMPRGVWQKTRLFPFFFSSQPSLINTWDSVKYFLKVKSLNLIWICSRQFGEHVFMWLHSTHHPYGPHPKPPLLFIQFYPDPELDHHHCFHHQSHIITALNISIVIISPITIIIHEFLLKSFYGLI